MTQYPPILLKRIEQLAVQDLVNREAQLQMDTQKILEEIAEVRGLTAEYVKKHYLVTPNGLIPQPEPSQPQEPDDLQKKEAASELKQ